MMKPCQLLYVLFIMILNVDAWADYPVWIDKSCELELCEVSVKILSLEDRAEFVLSESIAIKDSKPMPLRRINGFVNWKVEYRDGFSLLKFKAAPSNLQIKVRFKNAGGTSLSQTAYAFSGSSSGFIESKAFTYQSFQLGLGAGIAYNSFSQNDGENLVSYSSLASPTYYGELSYQRNKHRLVIGSKNTPGQIKSNEFSSQYTWQKNSFSYCNQHLFQRTLFGKKYTVDLCMKTYTQSLSFFQMDSLNQTLSKKGVSFLGVEPTVYFRTSFFWFEELLLEMAPSYSFSVSPSGKGGLNYSGGVQLKKFLSLHLSFGVHWFGDWINFRTGSSSLSVFNSTVEPRLYY